MTRNKRTLRTAVDLRDMRPVTSDDLLAMPEPEYYALRHEVTRAHLRGEVTFACAHCGHSVYAPLVPATRKPCWRHRAGAPADCPWWTGNPLSVNRVSALQFRGAQESPLHARVKEAVAEMLERDPATERGSVVVDRYLAGADGRRRPDVRAMVSGRPLAFEIQLATTQVPIIVAREEFYAREGRSLLWLTWSFNPARFIPASFKDIIHSHDGTLFSLDEEVLSAAERSGRFTVRAFRRSADGAWTSELCGLDDLDWPARGLAHLPDRAAAWHLGFRRRWAESRREDRSEPPEEAEMVAELLARAPSPAGSPPSRRDLASVLDFLASVHEGRPIASAQDNLRALLHTFLEPGRRHRYARLARFALASCGRTDVLEDPKVARKLKARSRGEGQETRDGPVGGVAALLYPEWFQESPPSR
ncbi:DUF6035 family protein [Antarcticirhabdus aurantiaca]|uniref:DUF6035 family protein n=1 Tax=Antarcticirhabdus aurantiaca TaxID=2606717 RepID=UPI00131D2525|nr:DUF6035 family protein [Antarcticirhabdus aurantiaca]